MPGSTLQRTVSGVAARIRRRPGIRVVVVAPAIAVIVGMAMVVSNSVADELREGAKEAAVHNVEAIVRGYVDPVLSETSLDLDARHDPEIDVPPVKRDAGPPLAQPAYGVPVDDN